MSVISWAARHRTLIVRASILILVALVVVLLPIPGIELEVSIRGLPSP